MGRDGAVVLPSKTITETESPGLAALKIKPLTMATTRKSAATATVNWVFVK
jgi:hypothetical protein